MPRGKALGSRGLPDAYSFGLHALAKALACMEVEGSFLAVVSDGWFRGNSGPEANPESLELTPHDLSGASRGSLLE